MLCRGEGKLTDEKSSSLESKQAVSPNPCQTPRDAQRADISKQLAKKKREASNEQETYHSLRRRSLYL
jgi:hypothetical protein